MKEGNRTPRGKLKGASTPAGKARAGLIRPAAGTPAAPGTPRLSAAGKPNENYSLRP